MLGDKGDARPPRGYIRPCLAACGDSSGDSLRVGGDGGGGGSVAAPGHGAMRWTGTERPLQWFREPLTAQALLRTRDDVPAGEGSPLPRTPRGDSGDDPSPCDGGTHSWLVARNGCDDSFLAVLRRYRPEQTQRLQPTKTWTQLRRFGAPLTGGVPRAVDSS
jgi:hypothetical protein